MPDLTDSHVHLHAYADAEALLDRAIAAGVVRVVGVGVDLETSRATIELARRRTEVIAAVGFHPARLTELLGPDRLAELELLARDPVVGLVGEIGIDTIDGTVPLARQVDLLRSELTIAQRAGKPVNLHLRGDIDAAFQVLGEPRFTDVRFIYHYFTGGLDLARRALDAGGYLSVGKPVTRSENDHLREAIRAVPLERLLIETDSYPLLGRTTEPADVSLVAAAVAALKRRSFDDVARVTTATLLRLISPSPGNAAT